MLHRATLGSLERFLGIVLEQHAGKLPPWLAPDQVVVLPVDSHQADYGAEVAQALKRAGLRASYDARDESLSRRIALAHEQAIPFIAVVGRREHEARCVSLRHGDQQRVLTLDSAVTELAALCAAPL
jgi:threonyl-tRNA synthetase